MNTCYGFSKKIWMNAVMEFHKNMNECFHGISQKYEWMLSWNFTKIWMNVVLELNEWMMSWNIPKYMNECCYRNS